MVEKPLILKKYGEHYVCTEEHAKRLLKKLAHRELLRLGKEFQKELPDDTTSLELLGRR